MTLRVYTDWIGRIVKLRPPPVGTLGLPLNAYHVLGMAFLILKVNHEAEVASVPKVKAWIVDVLGEP